MDFLRVAGAQINLVVGDIETVFLTASVQHDLTSSSLIKQIVSIGGYNPDRLARLVYGLNVLSL